MKLSCRAFLLTTTALASSCANPRPELPDHAASLASDASAPAVSDDGGGSAANRALDASTRADTVRMSAPSKPVSLTATAVSPYAVRLQWVAEAAQTSGFEVQVEVDGAVVRAALVDPEKREFVHHLRLPRQIVRYRVRAFNAKAPSEPSDAVTVTMPSAVGGPSAKAPLGPCVQLPTKPSKSTGCNPDIESLDDGNGNVVFNVPGGQNGCERHLFGKVSGCIRELGVFELQADVRVVAGHSENGWPLFHAIAGAGQYVGAQIQTLRFANGRYTIVDEALICGDSGEDAPKDPSRGLVVDKLVSCFPPFETCQFDW